MVFHVEVNFGGLPFIAEFVEQGGDQAQEGGFIGEEAGDAGAAFEFWLTRSRALLVRSRVWWASGRAKTVKPWGRLASIQVESLGALRSEEHTSELQSLRH